MSLLSGGFDGGFNSTDQTVNNTTNRTDVTNTSARDGSIAVRGGSVVVTDEGSIGKAFEFSGGVSSGALANAHDSVAAIADLAKKAFDVSGQSVYDSLALAGNRQLSLDPGTTGVLKDGVKNLVVVAVVIALLFAAPKIVGAFR